MSSNNNNNNNNKPGTDTVSTGTTASVAYAVTASPAVSPPGVTILRPVPGTVAVSTGTTAGVASSVLSPPAVAPPGVTFVPPVSITGISSPPGVVAIGDASPPTSSAPSGPTKRLFSPADYEPSVNKPLTLGQLVGCHVGYLPPLPKSKTLVKKEQKRRSPPVVQGVVVKVVNEHQYMIYFNCIKKIGLMNSRQCKRVRQMDTVATSTTVRFCPELYIGDINAVKSVTSNSLHYVRWMRSLVSFSSQD